MKLVHQIYCNFKFYQVHHHDSQENEFNSNYKKIISIFSPKSNIDVKIGQEQENNITKKNFRSSTNSPY